MIVYLFDQDGFYCGVQTAQVDPKNPAQRLMPANATQVAPPTGYPVEQCPKWNGSAWVLDTAPKTIAEQVELARLQEEVKQQNLEATNEYGIRLYEEVNGEVVLRNSAAVQAEVDLVLTDLQKQSLLSTLKQNIINKGAEITGGIDSESIAAFFQAYQLRAANPASYIADGLAVKYAVTGYAVNDALDTEAKITDYYNKVMIEMDKFREAEYATYQTALAAL